MWIFFELYLIMEVVNFFGRMILMKEIGKALSLITQLGISMLVPILICLGIGIFIDDRFGTSPWWMIIFIILGVGAGFRSVYMLTLDYHKDRDDPQYYKKK